MSEALRGHLLTFALGTLGFFAFSVVNGADPMGIFPYTPIFGVLLMGARHAFIVLWAKIEPRPDPGGTFAASATPAAGGATPQGPATGAPPGGGGQGMAPPAAASPVAAAPPAGPARRRRRLIWLGIYGVFLVGWLGLWLDRNGGPVDLRDPFALIGAAVVSLPIPAFLALVFTGAAYLVYRIFASQFERLDDLTQHGTQLFEPYRGALSQRAAVGPVQGQLGTLRFFGQMNGVDFSCELLTVNAYDVAVYTGRRLTIPFALSLVRLQVAIPAAQVGSAAVERALRQRLDRSLTVTRNATGFDISVELRLVEPDGTAGLAPPAFAEWMTSAIRTVWETAAEPRPDQGRPTDAQASTG